MLPTRWKLFRIACLLQVVIAGLNAGYSLVYFLGSGRVLRFLDTIGFTAIALFASLGLSLIHKNYPDILPVGGQKRYFNVLYIINFFLLSLIGAHVYSESWIIVPVFEFDFPLISVLQFLLPLGMYVVMLLLQVYILYGMFRLRRELYANYLKLVEGIAEK